tara:strand:+ start:628 stop:909 length:282 start_codon:yes stop_codon:yes gene_type:complete
VLQEKFLKLLKKYGYWKCRNIKRPGTGAFIRCPGDPIHSCPFLFEPPIKAQITKIPPRFPNIEQKRMFRYASEGDQSYFKKYEIDKRRKWKDG